MSTPIERTGRATGKRRFRRSTVWGPACSVLGRCKICNGLSRSWSAIIGLVCSLLAAVMRPYLAAVFIWGKRARVGYVAFVFIDFVFRGGSFMRLLAKRMLFFILVLALLLICSTTVLAEDGEAYQSSFFGTVWLRS